jgi:hypothetical protein
MQFYFPASDGMPAPTPIRKEAVIAFPTPPLPR